MSNYISTKLRNLVAKRASYRCEYCLLPQAARTAKHEIEHILPRQHDGQTVSENLALSCFQCNKYKGTNIAGYDSETGNLTPLFNPRKQIWTEHFHLEQNGIILFLTAEARVTAKILKFNDHERIEERKLLIELGIY